jgi:hypothetical protein|tara:strand:- start:6550 stop:6963 length:414 start_codon:yes stop_codon:yes gene_type:complete
MKKLIPLIVLMMMNLQSFSQTDTKTDSLKTIQLNKPIVRLVIKDLIQGDGNKKELIIVNNKINLLEKKVVIKDSVIDKLNERVLNFESMLNTKSNQIILSQELSLRLQTDLKKQKVKTKLMSGAGIVAVIGILLLSK